MVEPDVIAEYCRSNSIIPHCLFYLFVFVKLHSNSFIVHPVYQWAGGHKLFVYTVLVDPFIYYVIGLFIKVIEETRWTPTARRWELLHSIHHLLISACPGMLWLNHRGILSSI